MAKVIRDRVMDYYDRLFPGFGFAENKGYATADHLHAVDVKGASIIHRRTFKGVWREIELPFGRGDSLPISSS
jgi:ribonuclease HII